VLKPTSLGINSSETRWLHRRYDDNRPPGFRTTHIEKANRAAPPSKRDDFALSLDHLLGEREAPQLFLSMSFCTLLPISTKRRQTFSRKENHLVDVRIARQLDLRLVRLCDGRTRRTW
jgi:hypothetical protein